MRNDIFRTNDTFIMNNTFRFFRQYISIPNLKYLENAAIARANKL